MKKTKYFIGLINVTVILLCQINYDFEEFVIDNVPGVEPFIAVNPNSADSVVVVWYEKDEEFAGFWKVEYFGDWKSTPYDKKSSKRLKVVAEK